MSYFSTPSLFDAQLSLLNLPLFFSNKGSAPQEAHLDIPFFFLFTREVSAALVIPKKIGFHKNAIIINAKETIDFPHI